MWKWISPRGKSFAYCSRAGSQCRGKGCPQPRSAHSYLLLNMQPERRCWHPRSQIYLVIHGASPVKLNLYYELEPMNHRYYVTWCHHNMAVSKSEEVVEGFQCQWVVRWHRSRGSQLLRRSRISDQRLHPPNVPLACLSRPSDWLNWIKMTPIIGSSWSRCAAPTIHI